MSEEELVNDFLCLGGTSKRGTLETGGFGIAKAAIMSGVYWKVETLSHITDLTDIVEGNDIGVLAEPRSGTRVTVVFELESFPSWTKDKIYPMIYMSDVEVDLTINGGKKYYYHDRTAGLRSEKIRLSSSEKWEAFGIQKIEIDGCTTGGKVFARLNGLVQFEMSGYGPPESTLLVDLYTDASPDSKEYPFTMSRETVTEPCRAEIQEWVQSTMDSKSDIDHSIKRLTIPDNVQFVSGRTLVGKRKTADYTAFADRENQRYNEIEEWLSNGNCSKEPTQIEQEFVNESMKSPMMKLRNYTVLNENLGRDSNLVYLWGEFLEMLLPNDYKFGVGIIGDEDLYAMMDTEHKFPFFLINPKYVREEKKTDREIAFSMWISAAHESCHIQHSSHGEDFNVLHSFILRASAENFYRNMNKFEEMAGKSR